MTNFHTRAEQTKTLPAAAMTVDVEEYFQVAAFSDAIKVADWPSYPARADLQVEKILHMFNEQNIKATFFILHTVAKQFPALIRKIAQSGHEIASHGSMHQKADRQSRAEFRNDIVASKMGLEDLIGQSVLGYRAPSFSINPSNAWAFDEICNAGFIYSSSTYPIAHDHYGSTLWPREPFSPVQGLLEIPQSTLRVAGRSLPVGGGGYFRLMPYMLSRLAIQKAMQDNNFPYVFYFHPWEIDPDQPQINGASWKSSFRHYINQKNMLDKITKLSTIANWTTIEDVFNIQRPEHIVAGKVA